MADRYWVGGSGNWSSTTSWSASSGGASGASVPTAADNAIFNASSDVNAAITVTLTGASTCLNLDMSAIDQNLTFTGAFTLSALGNLALSATKTIDVTGITSLSLTATAPRTITGNGGTLTGGITFNSTTGTWTLQDAFTITGLVTHTAGTIAFNGKNFTARAYTTTSTSTRALNFTTANSTLTLTSTITETIFNITSLTGLTITSPSTSLVDVVGAGSNVRTIAALNLAAASALNFRYSTTAGTITATASMTVGNLTINCAGTTVSNIAITVYGNFTYTAGTLSAGANVLTLAAPSGTANIDTTGGTLDFPVTINGAGTFSLATNVSVGTTTSRTVTHTTGTIELNSRTLTIYGIFSSSATSTRRIQMSGTGGKIVLSLDTATTVFVTSTVTGLTTDGNVLVQLTGGGAVTKTISAGALTEANGPFSFQLSCTAGTVAFTASNTIKSLTIDNTAFTLSNIAFTIYGDLTIAAGASATLTAGINIWTFAGTNGQTITTNGKVLDFPITIVQGTSTFGFNLFDNLTVGTTTARTVTLTSGAIYCGGNTFTIFGSFVATGTAQRYCSGNFVITTNTTLTVWNSSGSNCFFGGTNVQLTGGGATVKTINSGTMGENDAPSFQLSCPAGTATFTASNTVYNLTIDNTAFTLSNAAITIYGSLTINGTTPTLTAGINAWTFNNTSSFGQTIQTNGKNLDFPLTFTGTSGNWTLLDALSVGTTTSRTVTLTNGYIDLAGFTFTIFGLFSSNVDNARGVYGNRYGVTNGKIVLSLNTASTVWNSAYVTTPLVFESDGRLTVQLTGGGAVTKTIKTSTNYNADLAISFQLSCTAGTVAFTANDTVQNLTIDNTAFTLSNIAISIWGNLSIGAGASATLTAGAGVWTFAGTTGTQTIDSGGKTLDFPITFSGTSIYSLSSNVSIGTATSRTVTLTSGTLELNSSTLTLFGIFSSTGTGTRRIQMSGTGGKIVLSTTVTVTTTIWATGVVTNFTTDGNVLVQLNGGGAGTKNIDAGSLTEANTISFQISCTAGLVGFLLTPNIKNLTLDNTSYSFSFNNSTSTIYGNLTINGTTPTFTAGTSAWTFAGTTGTQTITTNGVNLDFPITFNGTGIYSLADNLSVGTTTAKTVTLTSGTLELNSRTFTHYGSFSSTGTGTRRIQMSGTGGKIINSYDATSTLWNMATITNFTTDGNVLVQLTGGGAVTKTIAAGAVTEANKPVSFQLSSSAGTIAFTASDIIKNLTIDNNAFTISNIAITLYGNLLISGTTPTLSAGTSAWTFAGTTGTQTITTNGKTLDFPVTFSGTGTYTIASALTMGTTRLTTLTSGTLNINSLTLTTGTFAITGTGAKVLAHGTNGNLVISGSGITAFNATGSNFSSTGTGKINLTSASAKTFVGNGLSYATINQGGAGALTISGNNTFQDITNSTQPATITFTAGTTNTFTNGFSISGTSGNLITLGSTTTSAFTLSKSSGTVTVSYCSISYSTATGGAIWQSSVDYGNVDGGNNTGWIFTSSLGSASSFFMFFV